MHSPLILYNSHYYVKSRLMFGLPEKPSGKPSESLLDLIPQSFLYPPIPMIPLKGLGSPSSPSLCYLSSIFWHDPTSTLVIKSPTTNSPLIQITIVDMTFHKRKCNRRFVLNHWYKFTTNKIQKEKCLKQSKTFVKLFSDKTSNLTDIFKWG